MSILDSLVAFWNLDDGGLDQLGNWHLTNTSVTYDNTYANFNGTTSKAVTANFTPADGAVRLSYAAWIKRSATNVSVAWGLPNGTDAGPQNRMSAIWSTDTNIYFYCESSAQNFITLALAGTALHSIVVTYDGSQSTNATKFLVYVDGVVQTLVFSGTCPTAINNIDGASWTFGKSSTDVFGAGQIRCGAVWSKVLTQSEVNLFHNSGTPKKYIGFALNDANGRGSRIGVGTGIGT